MKLRKPKSMNLTMITAIVMTVFLVVIGASKARAEADINSYSSYLSQYSNTDRPKTELIIRAEVYAGTGSHTKIVEGIGGEASPSWTTSEDGYIEWDVDVESEGLYQIGIEYYPIEGKGSPIVRQFEIDGKVPFEEAKNITLPRNWTNEEKIVRDKNGNDIRPSQVEHPIWMEESFLDFSGYNKDPLRFYLSKGKHKLRLVSVKEPMAIRALKFFQVQEAPDYNKSKAVSKAQEEAPLSGIFVKIQGEDAVYKSDPMLYPISDRSSPATEPFDITNIRLNTIGGDKWKQPGQWLEWEFEVPMTGDYQIAVKARQNLLNGASSARKLLIDGKVPFREAEDIDFPYSSRWKMKVLGDEEEPYLFHLEKGKHRIRLETTLGDMANNIRRMQDSVYQLGNMYREILMITGSTPDSYRDYEFQKLIPDTLARLKQQSDELKAISQDIVRTTGQNGGQTSVIDRLVVQTHAMAEHPETIAQRFNAYKGNIGALGTLIMTAKQQPLEIDYLIVASPEQKMPKAEAGFFKNLWYMNSAFFASFSAHYDSLQGEDDTTHRLKVWIGSGLTGGRDQAQVLKQMIDREFTPKTGIGVDLQLVSVGALLPATIASKGPDVALELGTQEPMNYAVRHAVVDLTQFDDFREIASRFNTSALVPYTFDGYTYALPETQTFPILFYRKDILKELGIEVPQTWEDVIRILPVLQKKQMNFGLPVPISEQNMGAGMTAYATFLLQNGGALYKPGGKASDLDSDTAVREFGGWTGLYTNYELPLQYDFVNRFRIGEVPIGIADYSTYNMLSVFAPEINGLWDFALVPGTKKSDGTIDHSVPGGGNAAVILRQTTDKEASWAFLKWWTDAKTQSLFGREMESLLGTAARYPTANLEAFSQLPWTVNEYAKLQQQWRWVKGIPEVPGGYYTARYVDFAFKKVLNDKENPGEVLPEYVKVINEEIAAKRKEFGLDNDSGKEMP